MPASWRNARNAVVLLCALGSSVLMSCTEAPTRPREAKPPTPRGTLHDASIASSGALSVRAILTTSAGLYIGTANGVYRSTDGGAHWASMSSGLTDLDVRSLAATGDALFAGTGASLFRSADGGATWASVDIGVLTGVDALGATSTGLVVAGTHSYGAWQSTDDGTTWTTTVDGPTGSVEGVGLLPLSNGLNVFVGSGTNGVYRLLQNGSSWTSTAANGTAPNVIGSLDVLCVAVTPDFAGVYAGTPSGVWETTDQGASWVALTALSGVSAQSIFFVNSLTILVGSSGGGIYRSVNGGAAFTTANTGLGNLDVRSLAASADGTTIYAGTNGGGVFASTDGVNWTDANGVGLAPPIANAGGPYAGNEGTAIAFDGSGSSNPAGAALQFAWDFGDGTTATGATPSHTYADNGSYTVTLTVSDGSSSSTATASATIANVAPRVGAITAPIAPVQLNTTVTASASFTDAGILDTHTGVIDWGDGTTSPATISETGGSGTATGTHAFPAAGVYTVALTVTDKDGGSGQSMFDYVVVFDPAAGFVTGGGWITSPAGAYATDPSATGKATFGFVSRYQKGATVPSGNTQFQFQAVGFTFRSTSYDWLVISGAKAQYKGSGTVNGGGDYGFLLTAVDGDVTGGGGTDRFRIKIWDKATGGVVYDNQVGATDDATPTTALGGGSIVIHS